MEWAGGGWCGVVWGVGRYIDSDAHDPQKKDMQSMIDNMAKA